MAVKERSVGPFSEKRVATYLTATLRSVMRCEPSVVYIPWMESRNVPFEIMYRL